MPERAPLSRSSGRGWVRVAGSGAVAALSGASRDCSRRRAPSARDRAALGRAGGRSAAGAAVGLAILDALRGSRGPLLVAVDDLQWLDSSTAAALQIALRRLRSERIGVLATLREAEVSSAARTRRVPGRPADTAGAQPARRRRAAPAAQVQRPRARPARARPGRGERRQPALRARARPRNCPQRRETRARQAAAGPTASGLLRARLQLPVETVEILTRPRQERDHQTIATAYGHVLAALAPPSGTRGQGGRSCTSPHPLFASVCRSSLEAQRRAPTRPSRTVADLEEPPATWRPPSSPTGVAAASTRRSHWEGRAAAAAQFSSSRRPLPFDPAAATVAACRPPSCTTWAAIRSAQQVSTHNCSASSTAGPSAQTR